MHDHVRRLIGSRHIAVFGSGTRERPLDGYSQRIVEILDAYGADYEYVDVSSDPRLLQALTAMADIGVPQVYIGGQLIGGSDALLERHEAGTLALIIRQTLRGSA